jgi:membrane protein implicated in regulation of membrane protease activity
MAIVVAILLALLVVSAPWGWVLVGAAVAWEVGTGAYAWWWSRTRQNVVGPAALVGRMIEIDGNGWARVGNERWQVDGAGPGVRAVVVAVDGLTLVVRAV